MARVVEANRTHKAVMVNGALTSVPVITWQIQIDTGPEYIVLTKLRDAGRHTNLGPYSTMELAQTELDRFIKNVEHFRKYGFIK